MLTLNIDWNSFALTKRNTVARAEWDRASHRDIAKYKYTLRDKLNSVLPPSESLACHDVMCSNKQHIARLNSYSNQINRACLESAAGTITSISRPTSDARKVLPGWNEHVISAREKSILRHNIWLECGRPRDGAVADIMRRTCAAYHYAVHFVKQNNSDIVNGGLLVL